MGHRMIETDIYIYIYIIVCSSNLIIKLKSYIPQYLFAFERDALFFKIGPPIDFQMIW